MMAVAKVSTSLLGVAVANHARYGVPVMNKIKLIISAAPLVVLCGCVSPPTTSQNVTAATQLNGVQLVAAQQAHAICEEYGAAPGTRMFYNCMKEQTEAAEYQVALANCKSDSYGRRAKLECLRGGSGLIGLRTCLTTKEQVCENSARLAYRPDSNALKIEAPEHQYAHRYAHTDGGPGDE